MTVTTSGSIPPVARLRSPRPKYVDAGFRLLSIACGLLVLVILALIALAMTRESLPALREEGLGFFFGSRWAPAENIFGALPFIYGTLVVSAIALLLSVPVSIGIALFLTDVAPRRLRGVVSFVIDLLAAIPSVVYGLWGVVALAPKLDKLYDSIATKADGVPVVDALFGPPSNGKSFLTAGVILALMVTPIITSLTREVFLTTPHGQKEAAYALGTTRAEMIRATVLPHSRVGLIGAVMLGLGRAMGETIAVALVIGSSPQITTRLFASGDAMAAVIANQFGEASGVHRAALIGLGMTLFLMTILVNVAARFVVRGSTVGEVAR